jgi:hypothetical protein
MLLKKIRFLFRCRKIAPDLSTMPLHREILMQSDLLMHNHSEIWHRPFSRNASKHRKSWETYMKYILRGKKMDKSDGIEGIVYDEIWNLESNYQHF